MKPLDWVIVGLAGVIMWSIFNRKKKPVILTPNDLETISPPLVTQELEPASIPGPAQVAKAQWNPPARAAPYMDIIRATESSYNMPVNLIARVAYQESRFRPDIITGETKSSAGALGIMQIVPRWHPDVNPLNPADAIPYAGGYLKRLYNRFGTWNKALAAYNWGPTNLAKAIDYNGENWFTVLPTETKNYVTQITADVEVT